jgi:hypothetical protein
MWRAWSVSTNYTAIIANDFAQDYTTIACYSWFLITVEIQVQRACSLVDFLVWHPSETKCDFVGYGILAVVSHATPYHAEVSVSASRYYYAALSIEPYCNINCFFSLSLRFWRVQYTRGMN